MRLPLRLLICLGLLLPVAAVADTPDSPAPNTLAIVTVDGQSHPFEVEIARSDEERELGLMNRRTMPADHGMLFEFETEKTIYMWMKGTLIPLDMVFIDHRGVITGIAERAVPLSEIVIASPGPVKAVLELNGGTAERLGISVGDKVRHPFFGS